MGSLRPGRKTSRLGLALAAGGVLGGVYEIGALRALEESIEGLDLTGLHVYVGVSAGAFVGSHLANGITVTEMLHGLLADSGEGAMFDPAIFFVPAYRELRRRGVELPSILAEALLQFAKGPEDPSFIGTLEGLGRSLPVALFGNEAIRAYLHRSFTQPGRTDDFRELPRKLFVVATDVETGGPVVFGLNGMGHIPISKAVQASTAVPGLYTPVDIEGRVCVDGVLLKTLHASIALDHGAELLFCVNPLVPMNVGSEDAREALGRRAIQRGGLPALLSQAFRIIIHSRVSLGMERYVQSFPRADLLLFQPDPKEHTLFTNLFRFHSRRRVCEIAYDQTRKDLWERRDTIAPMLARHGLELRLDRLVDPERSVWDCTGIPGREATVTDRLDAALRALEIALAEDES